MRIAIIEDEAVVARRLVRMVREIVGEESSIHVASSMSEGVELIRGHGLDLLFLDLNLQGKDGFELLEEAAAAPSQTIVVSAHFDQAIRAFEYGVADFVPKPWSEDRLRLAIKRATGQEPASDRHAQRLVIRKGRELRTLGIADVVYARGADDYSELHLADGSVHLHEKSLLALERLLPARFMRVHRSFIVDVSRALALRTVESGGLTIALEGERLIPVGRSYRDAVRSALQI